MIGVKVGCDISVFIELRNKENGKWEELALYTQHNRCIKKIQCYNGRDYGLFGILAGVRCDSGSLVPLRGVPDDMSYSVHDEYGSGEYFHSETWYDFCELDAYDNTLNAIKDFLKNNSDCDYDIDNHHINMCGTDIRVGVGYDLNQIESLHRFVDTIRNILDAYDIYNPVPGDARIIMWFDS